MAERENKSTKTTPAPEPTRTSTPAPEPKTNVDLDRPHLRPTGTVGISFASPPPQVLDEPKAPQDPRRIKVEPEAEWQVDSSFDPTMPDETTVHDSKPKSLPVHYIPIPSSAPARSIAGSSSKAVPTTAYSLLPEITPHCSMRSLCRTGRNCEAPYVCVCVCVCVCRSGACVHGGACMCLSVYQCVHPCAHIATGVTFDRCMYDWVHMCMCIRVFTFFSWTLCMHFRSFFFVFVFLLFSPSPRLHAFVRS